MKYLIPNIYNKEHKTSIAKNITSCSNLEDREVRFLIYISNWINHNYLKYKKYYCEISYSYICKEFGWNRHKVSKTVKNLREQGYIYTEIVNNRQRYFIIEGMWINENIGVDLHTNEENIGVDLHTNEENIGVDLHTNEENIGVDLHTNEENIGVDLHTNSSVDLHTNAPYADIVQDGDTIPPQLENKFKDSKIEFRDKNKFIDVTSTRTRTEKLNKISKMYLLKRYKYSNKRKWRLLSNVIEDEYGIPNLEGNIEIAAGGMDKHATRITMFILYALTEKDIQHPCEYVHTIINKYTASSYDSIRHVLELNINVKYVNFYQKFLHVMKQLKNKTSIKQLKKYYSTLQQEHKDKLQKQSEEATKQMYKTIGKEYTNNTDTFHKFTVELIKGSQLNQKIMEEILYG